SSPPRAPARPETRCARSSRSSRRTASWGPTSRRRPTSSARERSSRRRGARWGSSGDVGFEVSLRGAPARYRDVGMDATATFEDFYGANRDRVFRTVSLALPGDADAAEATAEAFVRAFTRWRSVSRHPNPVGWVVKTAINHQRSRWRRPRIGFAVPAVESAPPEPLEPGIVLALRALPERQRQVVALRFLC